MFLFPIPQIVLLLFPIPLGLFHLLMQDMDVIQVWCLARMLLLYFLKIRYQALLKYTSE